MACAPEGQGPASEEPVDTDIPTRPTVTPPWSACVDPGTAAEGWTEIPLSDHPGLDQVLGSAYLQLGGVSIVVAHVEQDCFVALERPCTHEGVPIEYREERNGFVCPRHGAVYAWDGRVLSGPAPQDLTSFPVGPRDGSLWILLD